MLGFDALVVCGYISLPGSFEMRCVLHVDEVADIRRLYTLFQRYHEMSTEEEGFDWLLQC